MMLLPLRNQRPLRPIFPHWQDPGGSSQTLQMHSPGAFALVRDVCPAARPTAGAAFITAVAGTPSAKVAVNPADAGLRASFSFAESTRLLLAAAMGLTPAGANAAAIAAFPANRTNRKYFSSNCRHCSTS